MKKIPYILLLSIIFCKCIEIDSPIPESTVNILKGIYKGSGMEKFVITKECETQFFEFIAKMNTILNQVIHDVDILTLTGEALIQFSRLKKECKFDTKMLTDSFDFINKALHYPDVFLVGVFNNIMSIHVAAKYVAMRFNLSRKEYFDTGYALGDIVKYVSDINFGLDYVDNYGKNDTLGNINFIR